MGSSLDKVRELNLKLLCDWGKLGDLMTEFWLNVIITLGFQWADVGTVIKVNFRLDDFKVVNFGQEGFLFDKSNA